MTSSHRIKFEKNRLTLQSVKYVFLALNAEGYQLISTLYSKRVNIRRKSDITGSYRFMVKNPGG